MDALDELFASADPKRLSDVMNIIEADPEFVQRRCAWLQRAVEEHASSTADAVGYSPDI